MATTFKLKDSVRDVLARSTITSTSVKLPEQLDRKLYVDVDKALKAAGGKWDKRSGLHVFPSDPREALGIQIETGVAVNKKNLLQSFYTPDALADQVVEVADIEPGMLILEPSCGDGALIRAIRRFTDEVTLHALDINQEEIDYLREWLPISMCAQDACDFLDIVPDPIFDRIVMNPPFSKGQDMAHVTHAFQFLKPGGRLVAIMGPNWQHGESKKHQAFRELVHSLHCDVFDIPAGTFKKSGTNISTTMLVLDRP